MSQHSDVSSIQFLQHRIEELEMMMMEYLRLENLIEYAARDELNQYLLDSTYPTRSAQLATEHTVNESATSLFLYVDPSQMLITHANDDALEFLGYNKKELIGQPISAVEIMGIASNTPFHTYVETSIEEQIYQAKYRHKNGQDLPVQVSRRLLPKGQSLAFLYRLEDQSLHSKLWRELKRREVSQVIFREKFHLLNNAVIELCRLSGFDQLCRQAVALAVERLGFDRIGLWLIDETHQRMVGTYGIDESGQIRSENSQTWSYKETYIEDFMTGKTNDVFAYDEAPLYNAESKVIDYGWHISAPVLYEGELLGVLTVDNLLRKQPIKSYQPELIRLYGMTVGLLIHRYSGSDKLQIRSNKDGL